MLVSPLPSGEELCAAIDAPTQEALRVQVQKKSEPPKESPAAPRLCDKKRRAFFTALKKNQFRRVPNFLKEHPGLGHERSHHSTALMMAAEFGYFDCVRILLPYSETGAVSPQNMTALDYACAQGHLECVKILAPHYDVNARNECALSPLMHAAFHGHTRVVRWLLPLSDAKAGVEEGGLTALMHAAAGGKPKCVEALLAHSDARAATTPQGDTALMFAALVGPLESLQLLIPHSDGSAQDAEGLTAIECVVDKDLIGAGDHVPADALQRIDCLAAVSTLAAIKTVYSWIPEADKKHLPQCWARLEHAALDEALGAGEAAHDSSTKMTKGRPGTTRPRSKATREEASSEATTPQTLASASRGKRRL